MQFRTMPERQLDEHATCAAEYCWLTVRKDVMSDEMSKRDLAPMFTTDEETDITYSLFDVDGDGYVTEPEVHSVFKVMYRCAPPCVKGPASFGVLAPMLQCNVSASGFYRAMGAE